MRAPLLANKIDGHCFALDRSSSARHNHSQSGCDEMESGVILFIISYYGGGGGRGSWEIVKFLLSFRLGVGGGGGGEGERTEVPLCSLSPLIAVDNLKLRIDCPPLSN